ncbi:MAG: hypothetical protein NTV30_07765 [Chloroflexi bacterium]|nr:hypothetical protein [Chloroflexota bacterium]
MMNVRKALRLSFWGKLYFYTFWLSMIIIFVLAFYILQGRTFVGMIAGYSSFAVMRDIITLYDIFKLERLSRNEKSG